MSDKQQIRALIETWAMAAHEGDLDTVLADHASRHRHVRCSARDPGQRLRLTVGLSKTGGRWIVVHEHHSFPDGTPSPDGAAQS